MFQDLLQSHCLIGLRQGERSRSSKEKGKKKKKWGWKKPLRPRRREGQEEMWFNRLFCATESDLFYSIKHLVKHSSVTCLKRPLSPKKKNKNRRGKLWITSFAERGFRFIGLAAVRTTGSTEDILQLWPLYCTKTAFFFIGLTRTKPGGTASGHT